MKITKEGETENRTNINELGETGRKGSKRQNTLPESIATHAAEGKIVKLTADRAQDTGYSLWISPASLVRRSIVPMFAWLSGLVGKLETRTTKNSEAYPGHAVEDAVEESASGTTSTIQTCLEDSVAEQESNETTDRRSDTNADLLQKKVLEDADVQTEVQAGGQKKLEAENEVTNRKTYALERLYHRHISKTETKSVSKEHERWLNVLVQHGQEADLVQQSHSKRNQHSAHTLAIGNNLDSFFPSQYLPLNGSASTRVPTVLDDMSSPLYTGKQQYSKLRANPSASSSNISIRHEAISSCLSQLEEQLENLGDLSTEESQSNVEEGRQFQKKGYQKTDCAGGNQTVIYSPAKHMARKETKALSSDLYAFAESFLAQDENDRVNYPS
mmetsp:Transcript_22369/g.44374  ORF Transcript_22369/g.44374 Transcript_22369/m.44374 type:complete len:387 (-) Transcript_22369:219-1379(-)